MQLITLSGNPKSSSHIYKAHCKFGYPQFYMSKEGKDIKKQYQDEMWKQRTEPVIKEEFKISIDFYLGRKGKFDTDNMKKILLDAGNKVLWEDDGLIVDDHTRKFYDKLRPRIELRVGM